MVHVGSCLRPVLMMACVPRLQFWALVKRGCSTARIGLHLRSSALNEEGGHEHAKVDLADDPDAPSSTANS